MSIFKMFAEYSFVQKQTKKKTIPIENILQGIVFNYLT